MSGAGRQAGRRSRTRGRLNADCELGSPLSRPPRRSKSGASSLAQSCRGVSARATIALAMVKAAPGPGKVPKKAAVKATAQPPAGVKRAAGPKKGLCARALAAKDAAEKQQEPRPKRRRCTKSAPEDAEADDDDFDEDMFAAAFEHEEGAEAEPADNPDEEQDDEEEEEEDDDETAGNDVVEAATPSAEDADAQAQDPGNQEAYAVATPASRDKVIAKHKPIVCECCRGTSKALRLCVWGGGGGVGQFSVHEHARFPTKYPSLSGCGTELTIASFTPPSDVMLPYIAREQVCRLSIESLWEPMVVHGLAKHGQASIYFELAFSLCGETHLWLRPSSPHPQCLMARSSPWAYSSVSFFICFRTRLCTGDGASTRLIVACPLLLVAQKLCLGPTPCLAFSSVCCLHRHFRAGLLAER